MKTRSNDIIANAPFKYNSDTNTFEVGTNLYVDGISDFDDEVNLSVLNIRHNLNDLENLVKLYYDTDNTRLVFSFESVGLEYYLEPNTTSTTIVTADSVKTLFGNQSIYGGGNIDLYVHYLSFTINSKIYYGVVYSSNNLVVDSVQDLTTIMKSEGQILALGESDNALIAYVGGIWRDVFEKGNVTAVNDSVKTI